jgi:predicted aspartyl protease
MCKRNPVHFGALLACVLLFATTMQSAHADKIYKMLWEDSGQSKSPLIRVAFKGGQSRLFSLDTGAPVSILDRKAATELHLPIVKVTETGSATTTELTGSPIVLGAGGPSVPNAQFYLTDLSPLRAIATDMVGVIGMDLLANYTLRMDYPKKQWELIPGSVKGTVEEPIGAEKLPLHLSNGHYKFSGSLDDVKVDFNVDTGAGTTCVHDADVWKRLRPKAMLINVGNVGFAETGLTTGGVSGRLARLETLTIGNFKVKNPIVTQDGIAVAGIWLGNDFLQRFRVVIDFPAKFLYLTPDPNFKETLNQWDILIGKPTPAVPPGPAERLPKTGRLAAVPYELLPGVRLPVVSLSLNGGAPRRFLVDPGTANCLLDENFVKQEKLRLQTLKTEAETDVDAVLADRITFQAAVPFVVENVPFGLYDYGLLRGQSGSDIVGVLGANLLRAFVERIDFSKGQIEFLDRADFVPPGKEAHRVPIQTVEGLSYLKATVDDSTALFMIHFAVQDTLLQENSLLSTLRPVVQIKRSTVSNVNGNRNLRLHVLRVEGAVWDSPVVEHSEDSGSGDNVLGIDFFSRFHVTLDLSGKQLYLEPDPNYREDLSKWLGTGFSSEISPDGKMTVSDVLTPSPASEAGVRPGDIVLEINALPLSTTPISTIFAAIQRVEGAVVKLKVQRKGEAKPREFTMKMRRLL